MQAFCNRANRLPLDRAKGPTTLTLQIEHRADPDAVRRILSSLPDWFGIPEAIDEYVVQAGVLDSFLATDGRVVQGVALMEQHFPQSAELALIAVDPQVRGTGVGRLLVEAVESHAASSGCRLLEVHTVGPSYEHDGYAQTRAFYKALGFIPVHEFTGIDWDGPTLVLVKPL